MKLYIAGPMRGYADYNFPAFHTAAAKWRAKGFEVISPAEMDVELDGFDPSKDQAKALEYYMIRDLDAVIRCGGIVLLAGWKGSQGACRELAVAKMCGLYIIDDTTGEKIEVPMELVVGGGTEDKVVTL